MTDPLLRYFEQELTLVRRSLGQFGADYPQHAESLNIHQGKIEDPSIARLLDGVALLNAKLEQKLAEQQPETIEGLLNVLYPSYTQTIPSVAYFELTPEKPESTTLPNGSQLSAMSNGMECLFSTIDTLQISPYLLSDVNAQSAPFSFNRPKSAESTTAVIQLTLTTGDPALHFSHLSLSDFDFFVQGFENNADSLVELLLSQTKAISISDIEAKQHVSLEPNRLKSRISDQEFAFLPQHGNQFIGYQLINEFFFFKEKRQFFRLKGFADVACQFEQSEIIVNLFMSALPTEFIRLFNTDVFKLNVIPAINLFEQAGEPVTYDQRSLTLPVKADSHSDSNIEIIEIKHVYELTSTGTEPLTPLLKQKYHSDERADYWQSTRDTYGDFKVTVSLQGNRQPSFGKIYNTELLCSNGKQACGIEGAIECLANIDLPGEFALLYPPSAPIERERDHNLHWQFIALLNCNFASMLQVPHPEQALKQMLKLCTREPVSSSEIQMIRAVEFKSQVAAIRVMGNNIFSPGTEIDITLDTTGPFHAFSDVLNRFFQQFCSFDRYIQLTIRIYGRDGIAKQYPKLHGSQLCM
ncbi:type VI secretion system baseplate subunit TssF [Vibrio sp. TRT 21S02]|uniref:type VI secretion system baseplate subunit TssF n=1 Tax=Vibrio sp. TRT 21S02 TaxID=3418507 RepID=UPI003CEA64E6